MVDCWASGHAILWRTVYLEDAGGADVRCSRTKMEQQTAASGAPARRAPDDDARVFVLSIAMTVTVPVTVALGGEVGAPVVGLSLGQNHSPVLRERLPRCS